MSLLIFWNISLTAFEELLAAISKARQISCGKSVTKRPQVSLKKEDFWMKYSSYEKFRSFVFFFGQGYQQISGRNSFSILAFFFPEMFDSSWDTNTWSDFFFAEFISQPTNLNREGDNTNPAGVMLPWSLKRSPSKAIADRCAGGLVQAAFEGEMKAHHLQNGRMSPYFGGSQLASS